MSCWSPVSRQSTRKTMQGSHKAAVSWAARPERTVLGEVSVPPLATQPPAW